VVWLRLESRLTTDNEQPATNSLPAKNLTFDKKPSLVKKILALLLLVLPLLLAEGGCARRTTQQKKTSWYKHHSGGKAEPCPCGH
jgi:hypothetical protein